MSFLTKILFLLVVVTPVLGHAEMFTDNQCIDLSFKIDVTHKATLFGLLKKKLIVEKKQCLITIVSNSWKYLDNKWVVDVCREPVHIKYGTGIVEAYKKTTNCNAGDADQFCVLMDKLFAALQDDGLIFANGLKENLEDDHGKVYCSYELLQKYLGDSAVFNVGQSYDGILQNKKPIEVQAATTSSSAGVINEEKPSPVHGEF